MNGMYLYFVNKHPIEELIKQGINRLLGKSSADEELSAEESEDDDSEKIWRYNVQIYIILE